MSPNCYFSGGEVRCNCTETNMQIEGGHYRLTKHLRAGSMLVYNCPEGYYPYPAMTRLCQPNGRWRPAPKRFSPQRCRREWYEADGSHFASGCLLHTVTQILLFCFAVVECPDPSVLEYGNVSPPQEKYYVDNETTYECYSGYTMRGSSSRVCLPSGKWSGSTPICSRDCKIWTAIYLLSTSSVPFAMHPHSWLFRDFCPFYYRSRRSLCWSWYPSWCLENGKHVWNWRHSEIQLQWQPHFGGVERKGVSGERPVEWQWASVLL